MQYHSIIKLGLFLSLSTAGICNAQSPADSPRPIPLTRPELKRQIEDVKVRVPRIPLPELTDAQREQLGERASNYESRLRQAYLAGGDQASRNRGPASSGAPRDRFSRPQDPKMSLSNSFKVELFWIVSRTNNCQYCLGHQESKLLAAGLSEDRIASLDGDWKNFSPAERAAYAFARKYSFQPHLLADADVENLKQHFSEDQILEMMLSMAGNNSINRWKEGVGVPQNATEGGYSRMEASSADDHSRPRGTYLTPTSPEFENVVTQVAPVVADPATGKPTAKVICERPPLETRSEVQHKLEQIQHRQSRLALVDEATTRKLFNLADDRDVTPWLQLMANFPQDGVRRAQSLLEVDNNSDLNPKLKAQISWIVARYDRAWYAVNEALTRLRSVGCTEDEIFALDGDWSGFSASDRALFVVARNLAASPVILTDAEVEEAVKLAGPAAVVQTINYVTHRAAFDRLTEAAGLPLASTR